ncbi:MAG: cytochrome c3 family protein [Myxococcaceae bacterium]
MAQIFPKWTNKVPKIAILSLVSAITGIVFVFWYWFSPYNLEVGYQPIQPVPYSHKIHAGNLGMDCRYCHTGVEKSAVAGVPPTQTCMNCHSMIKTSSPKLEMVRDSYKSDLPIPWVRVHKVPDYAYFDHSAHIAASVGCVSCHGRIDQMTEVRIEKPLSMGWCLDCHRNPEPHLRPLDKITDMEWVADENWKTVAKAKAKTLHPPVESCSGCHR